MKKLVISDGMTSKLLTQEKIFELEQDLICLLEEHSQAMEAEEMCYLTMKFLTRFTYLIAESDAQALTLIQEALEAGNTEEF